MSALSWTASTSGDWTDAGDWSGGAVPGAGDDVTIDVAGITVSVSTGTQDANSLTTSLSVMAITGGTLAIGSFANLYGAYAQSGGVLTAGGNGIDFYGAATLSAGLLEDTSGLFDSAGGFSQTGGTLALTGNEAEFTAGLTLGGGVIDQTVGVLISGGTYTQTGGTLAMSGAYAEFTGASTLAGGVLDALAGSFIATGLFTETKGQMVLSGTGGSFDNDLQQTGGGIQVKTGTLGLYGASNMLFGTISGAGTLLVAGNANGLNGTTQIDAATVLSVAKLDVISGELSLQQAGKAYDLSYGGYLTGSAGGTVALGGNTLTLTGRGQLGADFTGGTILADGGGQLNGLTLDNSALLDIASAYKLTASQDGPGVVTLRADSQVVITSAGSLSLTGNDQIEDVSSNATLTDDGTLAKIGGDGTSEILSSFTEAAKGSISVGLGTIDFSGVSNSFSGTVSGAGTLSLGGDGNAATLDTFASSIKLQTAAFVLTGRNAQLTFDFSNSFTYAGSWDQSGGVFLLGNQGQTLTLDLTGSVVLDGGVLKSSSGTVNTTGAVALSGNPSYNQGFDLEGFTNFLVADVVDQTASIQLGAQNGSLPVATIEAGASWLLEDAASVTGAFGELVNDGTLEKYNGAGASSIDGTLINAGTLTVVGSTLVLDGSGTLGGSIDGEGLLALEGSGSYTLASGLSLTVAQLLIDNNPAGAQTSVVSLGADQSYGGVWAQHGGTLQLDGETLTLKGETALDGGAITGPGTLVATGSLTLGGSLNSMLTVDGQAELLVNKAAQLVTQIDVDGLGSVVVAKGGSLTEVQSANIIGAGTLSVLAGGSAIFEGGGYEQVAPGLVLAGAIQVERGELSFLGSVSGAGSLAVHAGAELDLMGSVVGKTVVNMSGGGASLLLGDAQAFGGVVAGFVAGDFIELTGLASGAIGESFSANGKSLTLTDSAQHTFTINFSTGFTAAQEKSIVVADGPHGYIGVYHT
jgi:hypothetical protein